MRQVYPPGAGADVHLRCDWCGYEAVLRPYKGRKFVGDHRIAAASNRHDRECRAYPHPNGPRDGDTDE